MEQVLGVMAAAAEADAPVMLQASRARAHTRVMCCCRR